MCAQTEKRQTRPYQRQEKNTNMHVFSCNTRTSPTNVPHPSCSIARRTQATLGYGAAVAFVRSYCSHVPSNARAAAAVGASNASVP